MVKNPPANAGDIRDASLIPGSGRSPGESNGNRLPHSCWGNPIDRGAWRAAVHGVFKESDITYYQQQNAKKAMKHEFVLIKTLMRRKYIYVL